MSRYIDLPIVETKPTVQYPKVTRYRASTRYPNVVLSEEDIFIRTVRGDRLDKIAYKYYNDPDLWWVISIANPDLPNDSIYPTLGFQLRIPFNIPQILDDFEQLNS
jgi:phage tail protein X